MAEPPAHADGERKRQSPKVIHRDEFSDYRGVLEPMLPVLEASHVQLEPGPEPSMATVFSSGKAAAVRVRHHVQTVGVVIMKPEYFAYMAWAGTEDCRINGVPTQRTG